MKSTGLLLIVILSLKAYSQNEFAAQAFYNSFNKILADSKNGFAINKGPELISKSTDISREYKATFMLPLADSGKVVVPATGNLYAVYYFEPEKKKQNIDKRAVNLREAILTATGIALYARTISNTIGAQVFSDTYIFTNSADTDTSLALYRISIFYHDKLYRLLLEIRGKSN